MNGVTVHKKLARSPLPTLEAVAKEFFEKILGERMSDEPVRVVKERVYTK